MPAGCVYFVSFYITGYPRDLDSIYFLLALRLECTRPIFDVGGRIFSGQNDRWIFLYFHSRSTVVSLSLILFRVLVLVLVLLLPALLRRELLLRLTATSGSIRPRITSQNNTKFDLPGDITELRWIPCTLFFFIFTCLPSEFHFPLFI